MATGSPVSFWYGTRAQFDSIETKLETTLYFITDEQALYKGTVKFAGSGVDTLLTVSATTPSASIVTTGDKYFDTTDNLIHVLLNNNGTVSTTATYEPANGALYYNATEQRFQTLVKDGSSYVPTEVYDAGISVAENGGLILDGTTLSGKDATTSAKGMVQVGDNLNVSDGVISAPTATNSRFGMVKTGNHVTNNNGVISVEDASTSTPGVVQLMNNAYSTDMQSETKAITPHAVDSLVADLTNNKQDNLTANAPVYLSGDDIGVNIGDGLAVGVTGTTNANKLIVNEASVKEVLEDVVDGGTEPAVNEIVTADNLKGALSVGQAVDVSCAPYNNSGSIIYVNDDFLQGFTATMISGTSVGFYDTTAHRFPKFADGLVYLFIANVSGSGTVTPNGASAVTLSDTPQRIWTKVTAADSGYISASANATMTVTNWRQYEVTALTDEAIAYIAQLPDPDAFFRSTSAYSIRDKYLIKQNMVCPFIPTINMPDNSDLTVAAGLSYKIKYTNDNPHTITADTIPTDAYGWDTHIQMFIKGTSAINFQKPLILMDALTPNAGHNLSVKWRNGDALVYVDDTNAGYIVTVSSGTATGSLYDGISNDYTDYVIFAAGLDGTTIDAGNVTFNGGAAINTVNVLGNGTDKTTITGAFNIGQRDKTINMQSLDIAGATFTATGAYGHNSAINLSDVTISGDVVNASANAYGPLNLNGVTIVNGSTVADGYALGIDNRAIVTNDVTLNEGSVLTVGSIATDTFNINGDGTGTFIAALGILLYKNTSVKNIHISSGPYMIGQPMFRMFNEQAPIVVFENCIAENVDASYILYVASQSTSTITGCTFSNTNPNSINKYALRFGGGTHSIANITLDSNALMFAHNNNTVPTITMSGTINLNNYNSYFYVPDNYKAKLIFDSVTFNMGNNPGDTIIYGAAVEDTELRGTTRISPITGTTVTGMIGPCLCRSLRSYGYINGNSYITIHQDVDTWSLEHMIPLVPIKASKASLIVMGDDEWRQTGCIQGANKIQLLAGSTQTVTYSNLQASDKVLDARLIVVGNDPASPSGFAYLGSTTVSGIGTYITKDGSNDFVANNTTNVVPVDASTTGAKYLGTVLSATTGETGANRFAKIDSGAVAVVNEATNAVNKQIITHDYEPILGGTFSVTSATVNEATKTTTILSGGTMSIVNVRGGKDSVIDLRQTHFVVTKGASASVNGVVVTNGDGVVIGGGFNIDSSAHVTISGCTIADCHAASQYGAGGGILVNNSATVDIVDSLISGNSAENGGGVYVNNSATANLVRTTVSGNTGTVGGNGFWCRTGGKLTLTDCDIGDDVVIVTTANLELFLSNSIKSTVIGEGTATIASGAIVDLTGNTNATPIALGGGIIVNGSCTVINSAGVSVSIAGGTYTKINNDGTTN